jgi:hypothetical protein
MEKAASAYSKGLRKYASRTEPLGYDRDHNAVYLFSSDPTIIFIEMRQASSAFQLAAEQKTPQWHAIESKSLYDGFFSCLDRRGIRENELCENLVSECARKNLYDDVKDLDGLKIAQRHMQELDLRIKNLRAAVQAEDDNGRRSGRLASISQVELVKAESEMQSALAKIEETTQSHSTPCYHSLTGFDALCDFDVAFMKSYLKEMPSIKVTFKSGDVPKHIAGLRGCQHTATPLWKGGGVLDVLSSELFELENWISGLAPKANRVATQQTWKGAANEWKQITSHCIGPIEQEGNSHLNGSIDHITTLENGPTPLKRNSDGLFKPRTDIRELEDLQEAASRVLESLKVRPLVVPD